MLKRLVIAASASGIIVAACVVIKRKFSNRYEIVTRPLNRDEELEAYDHSLATDVNVLPCRLLHSTVNAICGYDPLNHSPEFLAIKSQTHCLFAKNAKVWSSKQWNPELSFEDNVKASIPALSLFVSAQKGIDGFLFDMAFPGAGESVDAHASLVNRLLRTLSDLDPSGFRCMKVSYVGKRGWVFSFAAEELFVTTFAACYDHTNARYAYGMKDRAMVLFQPYSSFLLHSVGSDTPHTEWDNPQTIRDRIRCRFRAHGQEYFIPTDVVTFPVALQYVPPMRLVDPLIKWWTYPVSS